MSRPKAKKPLDLEGYQQKFPPDAVRLALAWARGDTPLTQIREFLGKPNVYIFLARALRQHIQEVE